jgi:hypothetical protein
MRTNAYLTSLSPAPLCTYPNFHGGVVGTQDLHVKRIASMNQVLPVLVARLDGKVCGLTANDPF